MNRRSYLAGIVGTSALLAGCTSVLDVTEEPTPAEKSTDDRDDAPFSFSDEPTVVDFGTAPLSACVVGGGFRTEDRLTGRIDFVATATASGPALLGANVRNDASFAQTFYTRRLPFFEDPPVAGTEGDGTAYLAPTNATDVATVEPSSTRDENGRWRLTGVEGEWFPETLTLEPGETVEAVYALLGHHDREEPPIEAGRYRFGHDDTGFTIAVWPTNEPGPTGPSAHHDVAVPPLSADDTKSTERETAWFHEATSETAVYLQPDVETTSLPGRIEFDFVNRSRESAGGNPHRWRVYKLVEGVWHPVYPWGWFMPASAVPPGDVDETTLHCFHGEALAVRGVRTVGHLGGGQYAYTVDYSVDDATHAALFDVAAPDVTVDVEPESIVSDEGDRYVVTLPDYADARKPTTVTIIRAKSADERVIAEQLLNGPFAVFRNSLPLFEPGVERVEVRTDRGTGLGPFDYEDGASRTVAYDGDAFEATGELIG